MPIDTELLDDPPAEARVTDLSRGTTAAPRWPGRLLLSTLVLVALGGCAHQPASALPGAPGFFLGLLHGFLLLVSLVGSLFTDVRVYAFPNSGFLYDLGFVLGATAALGGGAHTARRR